MPEQASVDSKQGSNKITPPAISLPKGGGAIRDMGEKFAANPVTATGKGVPVPLCVVYDLENDQIKRGRVYFEMPALMQQLGANLAG